MRARKIVEIECPNERGEQTLYLRCLLADDFKIRSRFVEGFDLYLLPFLFADCSSSTIA
jgi:hypothetical protein